MQKAFQSSIFLLGLAICMLFFSVSVNAIDPFVPDPAGAWFQKQILSLLGPGDDDLSPPQISGGRIFPDRLSRGDPVAMVSAKVVDPYGVSTVYAQVGQRLILMLDLDGDGIYTGYCGSNLPPGRYNISILAVDRSGNYARSSGDIVLAVIDPADKNENGIEDSLERLGPESQRVIVLHEGGYDRNATVPSSVGAAPAKYSILPASSMIVPGDKIEALSKMKGVKGIYRDQKLKVLAAPGALPAYRSSPSADDPRSDHGGFTGSGVTVALLDTGVDAEHQSLRDESGESKIAVFADFVKARDQPYDDNGHGTHCASLICGSGQHRGVAPGCRLAVVKVMDSDGACYLSDALKALDWCVENKERYGISIISFSVGGENPTDGVSLLDEACNRMADQGFVICVAAGNSGPAPQSIVIPGGAERAITVGAVDENRSIFPLSSRGPTVDGRVKPDLVTIGVDVVSATSGTYDGYSSMSGTSMAVPQVSGAAAILLQQDGSLQPSDVKRILLKSADEMGDPGPDNTFGYGSMNLTRALGLEQDPGLISGPSIASIELSRQSARVGEAVIIEAKAAGEFSDLTSRIAGPEGFVDIPMIDFDGNGIFTAWWETGPWTPGNYTVEVGLLGLFGERVASSVPFRLEPRRP